MTSSHQRLDNVVRRWCDVLAHRTAHAPPTQRNITVSSPRSADPSSTANDGLIAALDIGGTKIAGALVDRDGVLVHHARRTTPARESADILLGAVHEVLGALAVSPLWEQVQAVGIGSAGPIDLAHGTVSPVNIPAWRNFPLIESVARHPAVGDRPVTLAGDAVAMTAAEHRHGAARGHTNALCLVVSTGVGSRPGAQRQRAPRAHRQCRSPRPHQHRLRRRDLPVRS